MKQKIYAITLLLSFLMVLSHEMVFHHHDIMADVLFCYQSNVDSPDKKSKEWDLDEEQNHPLPPHQHLLAINQFVYSGTNHLKSNSPNSSNTSLVKPSIFHHDYFEHSHTTIKRHRSKQLIIFLLFTPEANALRGPPSFA